MDFRYVDIGKTVEYQTLETALVKAANEVGLKAEVEDNFDVSYRLGSGKENRTYSGTSIDLIRELRLRAGGIPLPFIKRESRAMFVRVRHKNPTDTFTVFVGGQLGDASDEEVQKYLGAVSKYLSSSRER